MARFSLHAHQSLARLLCVLLACWVAACAAPPVAPSAAVPPASSSQFACGGPVELATWALWGEHGLPFLRKQLIADRLQAQGDTYALYDMQTYFHNLAALAQRCQRPERMLQMADALMPVLAQLEPLPGDATQRAWVCRGGRVCNTRNKLVNKEVMLVSVQGLGLMSSLAQMMAASSVPAVRNHPFVAATAQASAAHLLRWGDATARANWQHLALAKPSDVTNGSSALFFTDKPLWLITIYANLAGVYAQQPALASALTAAQRQALGAAMRDALALFKARTTIHSAPMPHAQPGTTVQVADVDQGFWRLYADSRFAGYAGTTPPAVCNQQPDGSTHAQLNVSPKDVPTVAGLGWDISHARRLVHALSALQLNHAAMQQVYGLTDSDLPAPGTAKAFAAQLVANVWNGNLQAPLFTNYWGGANGWYRVAYENGTASCYPGTPPFGLSDSFATGGYATWAKHYPVIGDLARRIYSISQASDAVNQNYTKQYLRDLSAGASTNTKMLTQLMFWPTLIQ